MCSIEQQCDLKKAACDLKAASFILAVRIFAAVFGRVHHAYLPSAPLTM